MQVKPLLDSIQRHCRQETETAVFAGAISAAMASHLNRPDMAKERHINIALEGNLGAGKTAFARYFIQALGYAGKVKSPTYSLCEPYSINTGNASFMVFHFDLYRMRSPLEWQEAGLMEHFDEPGLCLVEWPEKAEGTLPPMDLRIVMTAGPAGADTERNIEAIAISPLGLQLLADLSANLP